MPGERSRRAGIRLRIAVTGAGGFLGGALVRRFARAGHDVLALARRPIADLPARARAQIGDLTTLAAFDGAVDATIHCAAEIPAHCPDPTRLYEANVAACARAFAASAIAGATHVVFCSSMSAYGRIDTPVVDTSTPSIEPDAYGRSKLEGERLLAEGARHGRPKHALALRLPGMVGAGAANNFLSQTMARILQGRPVTAANPDAPFNNVVHADDLADFLLDWLVRPSDGFACVPLAARAPARLVDVLTRMVAAAGRSVPIEFAAGAKRPFTIATADAERLGYRPADTLDSVERYARDAVRSSG